MPPSLYSALFQPRAVGLIGASADPAKNNSRAQRLLQKAGYAGRIIPVNPGRAEIMGLPTVARLQDAPGPIDHAFIMVPAAAVPAAIADCVAAGVQAATIFTAGFAEVSDEGKQQQEQIAAAARAGGLRLLGPNCLGLLNVTDRFPLSVNASVEAEFERLRHGGVSIVSQSGSMMGALMARMVDRDVGLAKLVSVGNECDVGVGELAELLIEDEHTQTLLLFLETFRDADRLARAARRAHQNGKTIAALKLGRSDIGRQLAASHTGAMLSGDHLAEAFFADHGILRVDMLEALVELPRFVAKHRPPKGNRVAALTGTGGAAALVLDRVGLKGHAVVGPTPEIQARLAAAKMPIADNPLIDLPMGTSKEQYRAVLSELTHSDHCDAVLAVLGNTARLRPGQIDENILLADRGHKPLAVFIAPEAPQALEKLAAADVAGFRTPESCADVLSAFLKWRAPYRHPAPSRSELAPAQALLAQAGASAALDEYQACQVFDALGIEVAASQVVSDSAALKPVAGPVAIKILSPDILHKTDAGLVELGVTGDAAVAASVTRMLARARSQFPQARIRGVLVAPMQRGLAEVILGFKHDAEVGPVVMLGMGGVLAEIRRSVAVRIAPVDEAEAAAMIAELPDLRALTGFRNLPRGDVAALARAISRLSYLAAAAGPAVTEAEINPLIVRGEGQGVVAVDGLIVTAAAPSTATQEH
jgi:acyl-CoA synthetase (NDP forming)